MSFTWNDPRVLHVWYNGQIQTYLGTKLVNFKGAKYSFGVRINRFDVIDEEEDEPLFSDEEEDDTYESKISIGVAAGDHGIHPGSHLLKGIDKMESLQSNGWEYCSDGSKSSRTDNGSCIDVNYGAEYGEGDIIKCDIDVDARSITFSKNGISQGVAFRDLTVDDLYVACCVYGIDGQCKLELL